ncbi:hypothetical protein A2U01_0087466, partial [Trifolium medium]|nr:hypothetical protein [Trifolium medium]
TGEKRSNGDGGRIIARVNKVQPG